MSYNEMILEKTIEKNYFEEVFDAYLIMDPGGFITYFSNSVLKIFNKTAIQIDKQHICVLFPGEQGLLNEYFKNRQYEFHNGNEKLNLLRTRFVMEDDAGNVVHIVEGIQSIANYRKVNDLKTKIEKEQLSYDHDHNDFINWKEMYAGKDQQALNSIIYALNTSLNSMGGPMMLDFVKQHIVITEDGYHIDQSGYEVLDELIKTLYPLLTNIAKLEQLLIKEIALSEVPLEEFIECVKKCAETCNLNRTIQNTQIHVIHVPCDYGDVKIKINQKYLEEIVSELLTNAFKYSMPGENIWIDIELNSNILKCKIINIPLEYKLSGREIIGVPYEYTEKVFNPFERLNWNISNNYPENWSFGLGLFAVRKMIEKMKGKIECYNSIFYMLDKKSKPITTFCIALPLENNDLDTENLRRTK